MKSKYVIHRIICLFRMKSHNLVYFTLSGRTVFYSACISMVFSYPPFPLTLSRCRPACISFPPACSGTFLSRWCFQPHPFLVHNRLFLRLTRPFETWNAQYGWTWLAVRWHSRTKGTNQSAVRKKPHKKKNPNWKPLTSSCIASIYFTMTRNGLTVFDVKLIMFLISKQFCNSPPLQRKN